MMTTEHIEPQILEPKRVEHSYTQSIQAPPQQVFPLLCPVRDIDHAYSEQDKNHPEPGGMIRRRGRSTAFRLRY